MIITVDKKQKNADLTPILDELYLSLKKIDLPAYKDLQRAAGFVAYKAHQNDHPLAWGHRLAVFLQSSATLNNILLTRQQKKLIRQLADRCRYADLNFTYLSPVYSVSQFKN